MFKRENFPIADIYVPVKRRATLIRPKVDELAALAMENAQLKIRLSLAGPSPAGGPASLDRRQVLAGLP